jgi:cellobiose phosphorylase
MREDWETYVLHYRYGETRYHVRFVREPSVNGTAGVRAILDGVDMRDNGIPLVDDHAEHDVEVRVSPAR